MTVEISHEKLWRDFNYNFTKLYINLWKSGTFMIQNFPFHEHGASFHLFHFFFVSFNKKLYFYVKTPHILDKFYLKISFLDKF